MAQQTDQTGRGKGLFFDLDGSTASAGATMAWAWNSVGATGCSRNGKGALIAGAFVPRIALSLPQESGSGSDASWRISDYVGSTTTRTAGEIVGENVWFSTAFNAYANKVPTLPFDHHDLAGLVAPRPLLAIENTDYAWLVPLSSYGAMSATKLINHALGADAHFGFSQVSGHAHCSFPSSQQPDLDAYVNRYLKNQTSTGGAAVAPIFRTIGGLCESV
ncbi:hypothetical protein MMC25_003849 [Agyrium rufum]|nr:hypothetical protein [Agyrium rufum]